MQDRIARVVHDVLDYGLELKQRIADRKMPSLQVEQQRLLELLTGDSELNYNPEYGGEPPSPQESMQDPLLRNRFLGIKYALACWLDEIFINDAPPQWSKLWTESTLEVKIWGGTQQRAWRFWHNAVKAEGERSNSEALEVYLWCVLLGFRGDPGSEPRISNVPDWINSVRKRVISSMPKEFTLPNDREAPSNVPPLYYRERFATMLRVLFFTILLLVILLIFVFSYSLGK